jgi:hypothetical protein
MSREKACNKVRGLSLRASYGSQWIPRGNVRGQRWPHLFLPTRLKLGHQRFRQKYQRLQLDASLIDDRTKTIIAIGKFCRPNLRCTALQRGQQSLVFASFG